MYPQSRELNQIQPTYSNPYSGFILRIMSCAICHYHHVFCNRLTAVFEENATSLFRIGPLLQSHEISTIINGVISSIVHSHLKFHRNFLNLGGGVKRMYNLLCILGANLLQTHPTPLPSFVGYNYRLKPSVFFSLILPK